MVLELMYEFSEQSFAPRWYVQSVEHVSDVLAMQVLFFPLPFVACRLQRSSCSRRGELEAAASLA